MVFTKKIPILKTVITGCLFFYYLNSENMKTKPFSRLTPVTLWKTVFPSRFGRWKYMGYGFNIFKEGTEGYEYIEAFFRYVDSKMRPWWCPKTVLRLLHLLGNDNSIVRIRWWWAHNLYRKITKDIFITDVKTKWDTLRVYGYFTDEIDEAVKALEKKVNPIIKLIYETDKEITTRVIRPGQ